MSRAEYDGRECGLRYTARGATAARSIRSSPLLPGSEQRGAMIIRSDSKAHGRGICAARANSLRWVFALLVCAVATWMSAPAQAVIIDSGDGTGNTTAPPDDPGWDNVGVKSGLTVVYLRNGWILTANHVGIGDVILDGIVYSHVPGSGIQLDNGDGTFADLLLFSITPLPPIPDLTVRTNTSLPNGEVIMIGRGRDRGAASDTDDPGIWTAPPTNPVPAIPGWYWTGSGTRRWGTNEVTGDWTFSATDTVSFYTTFDESGSLDHTPHECQAAGGDSGGGLFAKQGMNWELAGIIWAIAGYSGQNANTSALRGNVTLVADLSFYADDINAITATVPEPGVVLQYGACAALLTMLKRRRQQARR